MNKLLYIQVSPRKERSHSLAVADAFIESYRAAHPDDEIKMINLFLKALPAFDGNILDAKYAILHGLDHSEEQREAWKAVETIIDEFRSVDKYVFAVPMWNFHLPYILKQYFDIIVQPSYTFSYSPEEGYKGLITKKPVFIAYARGGEYPPGSDAEAIDFQTRYMKHILGFIGFTDIRELMIEPTLANGPETAKEKQDKAITRAREMARIF